MNQWGGAHVWKVGGKIFAIGGWDKELGDAYSFKTSELNFNILKNKPEFKPAPHLASRSFTWIQAYDLSKVSNTELKAYLVDSHKIICSGLSKKKQQELGLVPSLKPHITRL